MNVIDLAKILASHISQGRGKHSVALFQWQHGSEPATELIPRDACDVLEIYSGTVPTDDTSDLI